MKTSLCRHRRGICGLAILGMILLGCMLPKMSAYAAESSPYYGITIDGDFSDWDSVQKYPGGLGINEVAFVFDGDYLYVYISEPQTYSAGWSGVTSSGKFTIVTDLGYETVFQLTGEGGLAGVDGATWAHSSDEWGLPGYYWEIAIPASNLKTYNQTVSFGHYLADSMYVNNVANLSLVAQDNNNPSDVKGDFNGIVYDGNYDDWLYYPHEVIEWATAGSFENVPDAEAALYSENGILFGHVVTVMEKHLIQQGAEFATGEIKIRINDNDNYIFWPKLITVDAAGNINENPQTGGLNPGTYEFYIIDNQGWYGATNISQWTDPAYPQFYGGNAVYGKMMVTIGPSKHNMEFQIDIPTLARKFGMEADNVHVLSANYRQIGGKWVTTAGTSTGPVLGLVLCMSVIGCSVLGGRRRKTGRTL